MTTSAVVRCDCHGTVVMGVIKNGVFVFKRHSHGQSHTFSLATKVDNAEKRILESGQAPA